MVVLCHKYSAYLFVAAFSIQMSSTSVLLNQNVSMTCPWPNRWLSDVYFSEIYWYRRNEGSKDEDFIYKISYHHLSEHPARGFNIYRHGSLALRVNGSVNIYDNRPSNTIILPKVTEHDQGEYKCRFLISHGRNSVGQIAAIEYVEYNSSWTKLSVISKCQIVRPVGTGNLADVYLFLALKTLTYHILYTYTFM